MKKFTPKQYLEIDIANSYGMDKNTWDQRLSWFENCRESIEQGDILAMSKGAKEPAQFLAGVLAYRDTLAGQPTGYLCGLDATASGLQLLSVLSGCRLSARTCNLVNTGKREDAYTLVYTQTCNLLGIPTSDFPVSRTQAKNALMTHLYGSRAVPKEVFGEGSPALAAFYESVDVLMPGANTLNQELLALWNPGALTHEWVLPDGFEVCIKVMDREVHTVNFLDKEFKVVRKVNRPTKEGLSLGANIVHSIDGMVVREVSRRCNYDTAQVMYVDRILRSQQQASGASVVREKDISLLRLLSAYEASGFMSAVIFEHIDEANMGHVNAAARSAILTLIDGMPERPFAVICVHDCFKFHANYGNDVRQQYINILAELADSDVLNTIVECLTGQTSTVTKVSAVLSNDIRQSDYAIC